MGMKEVEPTYTARRVYGLSIIVCAFFFALLFLTCGISQAFDTSLLIPPKEAVQAAREGLPRYLQSISDRDLSAFNFHNRDEFKNAKVGTPFRVFGITHVQDRLRDTTKSLMDLIAPGNLWYFPVISKDEYRTILFVDFTENKWKAFGIGDSDLAKSFAHVMADWPASKGYKYVFVGDHPTYSEFIILIHQQKISVIPLPNAVKVWGLKGEKVLDQSEALYLFKKRLNEVNSRSNKGLFD
jgi:hypothetical protein